MCDFDIDFQHFRVIIYNLYKYLNQVVNKNDHKIMLKSHYRWNKNTISRSLIVSQNIQNLIKFLNLYSKWYW